MAAEVEMNGVDSSSLSASPVVRAAVVQASTIFYDTPATLVKAEKLLEEAAGLGAELIVFPEAFLGGYPRGLNFADRTPKGKESFRKYHASAIDVPGPEVARLAVMAGKYKIYLVIGVIERDGYTLYCTVIFFDSQGQYLGKHRKLMPTALERLVWGFGDGSTIPVYDTPIGKLGSVICWENKMPLLRTAVYAKGIEIYCAPTADTKETWQASMIHIALEGGCFVLSANQFCRRKDYPPPLEYNFTGKDEDLEPDTVVCSGGSVIVSPMGSVLVGPNYEGEGIITADLDLGDIARAKFDFDVVGHYSRPDVLSLVVKEHKNVPVAFTTDHNVESARQQPLPPSPQKATNLLALIPSDRITNGSPFIAEVNKVANPTAAVTVRATVVQASTIFYDTPATLVKAERLLAEAAAYGLQLVVFPEAFIGGYPRGSNFGVTIGNRTAKGKEDFRKYHASAIDVPGPEVERLAAMAGKYKVFLVMGVIERDGYTLYCAVLFFDPQGRYLGKHRKIMPTALERVIWGFGDGSTIPVFETPIGKIGAAICWENRMPLLRTAIYAKGIEIYCAPTADSRDIWQASMTHIALEGGCFVLSANQFCRRKDYPPPPEYVFTGSDGELDPDCVVCAGGSVIMSTSGTVLAGPN